MSPEILYDNIVNRKMMTISFFLRENQVAKYLLNYGGFRLNVVSKADRVRCKISCNFRPR